MDIGRSTSDPSGEPSEEPEPPPSLHVEVGFASDAVERAAGNLAGQVGAAEAGGFATWCEQMLREALGRLGQSRGELSVVIIDDQHMAALHDQYMQIPETTDVLTFDLRDEAGEPIEGEVYICLDEARRQAAQRGHPVAHELLLYAVHGLLHLLGHDDHDERAYQRMHAAEDRLLQELGVGRVFDVNDGGE